MKLLREKKERQRKTEIERIENKKNEAIRQLTKNHEQKYAEIKEFYLDIRNTNFDIIRQLKLDLEDANANNSKTQRQKVQEQEKNKAVERPLNEATKKIAELLEFKEKHNAVVEELQDMLQQTQQIQAGIGAQEWEYEVKLQQYEYLKREKQELYEKFHQLVYELHKKTGLRNLILERKSMRHCDT